MEAADNYVFGKQNFNSRSMTNFPSRDNSKSSQQESVAPGLDSGEDTPRLTLSKRFNNTVMPTSSLDDCMNPPSSSCHISLKIYFSLKTLRLLWSNGMPNFCNLVFSQP